MSKQTQKTQTHDANGFSKPVATIQNGNATFEIHAYRAGTSCRIAPGATMEFGASIGSKSAGLVYVSKVHGISAQDSHVDEPSVWNWVQEWMQKGMDAENRADEIKALEAVASQMEAWMNHLEARCAGDEALSATRTALKNLATIRDKNKSLT